MFGFPILPVWKGLVVSTTAAWFFLHLFLAVAPRFGPGGGGIVIFLPISVILVLCASTASLLDLYTNRERVMYANIGVGRLHIYGASVVWLAAMEALLAGIVVLFGWGRVS